ncbi:hypothetical protein [Streptomyces sp. MS2.AVA.5]|uniref:Uncharacterized protein n=1 Tax=Streptomyces achmelvichensis TaxID=3134111 RepID=A0ACC6PKN7_9ACTN
MTTLRIWRMRLSLLGSARPRLALLIAAVAATTFTLLTTLPAHAAPTPTPSPSAPAAPPTAPGQRTPSPEEMDEIEELLRQQGEKLGKAAQESMLEQEKERLRKLLPDEGGVLGVFNVTDSNGMPISVYTVKSDTGDLLDWDLGVQNLITELNFMITKWVIAFCCWLIAWALSFGLAKLLLAPVLSVAQSLHARVILEMGLPSLFLAVCALICVGRIFFGDKAKGWGDAALSLLLAALTTTLLASPPQTLLGEQDGAIAVTRGIALEIADVILDANPAEAAPNQDVTTPATNGTLSRPLTDALTDAFIAKPAMLLQYGRVFDGECATAYADTRLAQLVFDRAVHSRTNKIKKYTGYADFVSPLGLAGVPVNSSLLNMQVDLSTRWATDHFGNPPMEKFEDQCVTGDVDSAKKASLDKVGGSIFLLIAALIVTVLISGLAGSFLVAQCRIAWDAVRGEPALVIGTIPGAGRAFLWDWAASVVRSLGQMITSVIGLAVFIVIVQAVLNPVQDDWGRELTLRFLVVDIVCIGAVMKRKKLAARSKQVAHNWRAKMAGGRIGGTHGSAFGPPASDSVTKRPRAGRALVRSALVGVSLAQGNPVMAAAYSMPSSMGATTLMYRLNGRRGHGRSRKAPAAANPTPGAPPRPATGRPNTANPGPTPGGRPSTAPRPAPNRSGVGPRPNHRPGAKPARTRPPRTIQPTTSTPQSGASNAAAADPDGGLGGRTPPVQRTSGQRNRPRHPLPPQPSASPRQQQLRQRLDRGTRRTPPRDPQ